MIDPLVRAAAPADAAQLSELAAEARTALADQRGGRRWLADHPPLDWNDPTAIVHVAHIDELIVGYLVATVHPGVPGPDDVLARVREVYVTPAARELGFGDELLAAAIARVREAGATALDAHALPGDRDTKNLYERAGIKARLIVVSTPL